MRSNLVCLLILAGVVFAQDRDKQNKPVKTEEAPALTIYNQDFAVVRQTLPLELKTGTNQLQLTDITSHLEPDSVILRDLKTGHDLRILEQDYRSDVASQARLLSLYEGKTIDFMVTDRDGNRRAVPGKIIRSGYTPHVNASAYAQQYYQAQQAYAASGSGEPLIEMDGKLQFTLPGLPVFPALADDTILKPTLSWLLQSDKAGATTAEFSYVTGGMSWQADYNIVAPVAGNVLEMVGWVTLDNQTGKTFPNARIKLMAGDVNKILPNSLGGPVSMMSVNGSFGRLETGPAVTERTFDEYHLYTLERATTLHDRETKQVEFVRASGIQSQRIYVYDGMKIDPNYRGYNMEYLRNQESYGIDSNPKVWAMQEFKNSRENNLGMPLPKGRVRFYRRDNDGQLEFTGENQIDHTPADETIRLYTGNAFDAVGERRRTSFRIDTNARWIDESFEIKLRNHKKEPVEIRVVEHLYRWTNWEISKNTTPFEKRDSKTIEFRLQVPPDGEKTVSYMVHYSW